jgi:hypothetical protein
MGTIPLPPNKCPTSQRNPAPHPNGTLPHFQWNQCPTPTGIRTKHSKHFSLVDALSIGVDRMQRNLGPLRQQIEAWQQNQITDPSKLVIYQAFIEGGLEVPRHLARTVHDFYFNPRFEGFAPRTMWSLSNAFSSAFQELDPIPQFKATAQLGSFLEKIAS